MMMRLIQPLMRKYHSVPSRGEDFSTKVGERRRIPSALYLVHLGSQ